MEDGYWLSSEDKLRLASLKQELVTLKAEHKEFAKNKGALTPEQREQWRENSRRTNQVHIDIKDLRHKNVLEAGR
jgi:hypothetical protein